MAPEERLRIFDQLSAVLISDFQKNFHDVLAEAFTATAFTPEQANNEIRNTLIHCARVCAAETMDEVEKNIEQARWHINLAVRDCFQICILQRREDIVRILEIAEYRYGAIKHPDRQRLRHIDSKMEELLKKEVIAREDQNLTSEFEASYKDICDFYKHVVETYSPTARVRSIWFRTRLKIWRVIDRTGTAIVGLIIVAILSSSFMPPKVKAYYNAGMKHLFCKIASDASCN
jgi:hypothetical protein